MPERVVVTGYGAITPLGLSVKETWLNLVNGVSGEGYITLFDGANLGARVVAEVKGFDPLDYLEPMVARYTDRFTQFALAASIEAARSASLKIDDGDRYDVAVLIGSGVGGIATISRQFEVLTDRGPVRVSPYLVPMMISDSASAHVSMRLGARGMNLSLVSACATGTDSLGVAYQMIKSAVAPVVIAGGADAAITPIGMAGFAQARALSRSSEPGKASRPFDARRDGFVMGEGAAVVILESLSHARARDARVLAELVGYGATSDAYHVTQPLASGEAGAKAVEFALAGLDRSQVGYINAHGTSTPLNDAVETRIIKRVFGNEAYQIPVSSIKSMVGHMLGAAGALEAIVCCEVINEGILPPTINLEFPDPECDLDYVPNVARKKEVSLAISNSFGFGGHNSVLVFRKYSD